MKTEIQMFVHIRELVNECRKDGVYIDHTNVVDLILDNTEDINTAQDARAYIRRAGRKALGFELPVGW